MSWNGSVLLLVVDEGFLRAPASGFGERAKVHMGDPILMRLA